MAKLLIDVGDGESLDEGKVDFAKRNCRIEASLSVIP
jgi:hypothetical protein